MILMEPKWNPRFGADMQQTKLTKRVLDRTLKMCPKNTDVWDSDLEGLHVRVRASSLAVRISYYTRDRKRKVVTLGKYPNDFNSVTEIRSIAREVLGEIAKGNDPHEVDTRNIPTVLEYLEGPYTVYQDRRKDGSGTLRRIKKDFPDWLDKPLDSLKRIDVENWQASEEKKPKPRAFLTLKRSYDALQAMLTHAVEREVIESNPLRGVKLQRPALKEDDLIEIAQRRRYLDKEEVKKLFNGLDRYRQQRIEERNNSRSHGKKYLKDLSCVRYVDHVEPYILLMYYTGFRPGDLHGLRWEHVSFENKTIRKVVEKTSHHNQSPTTFPLSSKAIEVLEEWNRLNNTPNRGYVFPSPVSGKRLDQTAMQRPWKLIKKLGSLPESLDMYSLRHNFASKLVMSGVDIVSVSKLMAHSDIKTTIEHYSHLAPDHTRKAVEQFVGIDM